MEFIARQEVPLAFKASLKFIMILSIIIPKKLQHMKTMMSIQHNERMQLMSTTRGKSLEWQPLCFSPNTCVF